LFCKDFVKREVIGNTGEYGSVRCQSNRRQGGGGS
jgi:hypothetical protein